MGKTRIAMGYVVNHFAFTGEGKKPRVLYVSVTSLFEDVVRDSDVGGDRLQPSSSTDNTRKILQQEQRRPHRQGQGAQSDTFYIRF